MDALKPEVELFHAELRYCGCPVDLLDDCAALERILREAAAAAGMQVIHGMTHRFHPHGVTGYLLLAESHISIHTWPEHGEAVVDILTCNGTNVRNALKVLADQLCAQQVYGGETCNDRAVGVIDKTAHVASVFSNAESRN
jgi:S-adenosylmethionine decarboxylase